MTRDERLRYEMFLRVRDFGNAHRQQFPDESMGGKAFRAVEAAIAEVEARATEKVLTAKEGALAALRRAVMLEPDNWRHQVRLSLGSWGEERLRAARQALRLLTGCPLAHLLAATVFVARDALAEAEHELDAGIAAMSSSDAQQAPARFSAIGLYWLNGLLCLARGAAEADEALAMFEKELALEARGHMYAREMAANTWYAIGAVRVRCGNASAARAAFEQAIARVPHHVLARAGLALLERGHGGLPGRDHGVNDPAGDGVIDPATSDRDTTAAVPMSVNEAVARAISLVTAGDAAGAAQLVSDALTSMPPGSAGWLVPIEPMLGVQRAHSVWAAVLAALRTRAA